MDFDLGKLWMVGAGLLVGAIAGGWIWAQRAAALARSVAERAGEDAILEQVANTGGATIAAALKGAAVGGLIGVILVGVYFYFSNPDRGMRIEKVDTGDDRY